MTICFTQYLLPDGKRMPIEIDRPKEIEDRAAALAAAGFHFEIEILRTAQVSMTIGDHDGDYVHLIRRNEESIICDAVDSLMMECTVSEITERRRRWLADGEQIADD